MSQEDQMGVLEAMMQVGSSGERLRLENDDLPTREHIVRADAGYMVFYSIFILYSLSLC